MDGTTVAEIRQKIKDLRAREKSVFFNAEDLLSSSGNEEEFKKQMHLSYVLGREADELETKLQKATDAAIAKELEKEQGYGENNKT